MRVDGERYETLFQRLVSHVEDNLLTTDSDITFDGAAVTENEDLSPTCERLLLYIWLTRIDQRLPSYVARTYAHDLQSKSLRDIQPQICQSMDSLLAELNAQEDVQVNYSNSRNSCPSFTRGGSNSFARQRPQNYQHNTTNKVKSSLQSSRATSCWS